jgi:hypothetical protein
MTGPNPTSIFVFDANFFISLKEIKATQPYLNLARARNKLHLGFYVSGMVFNEVPFITGSLAQNFSRGVTVENVKDSDLDQVKQDLQRRGVRSLAQDPDLTLIALGRSLKKADNEVFIVTDDFKLAQNIETLGYRIRVLPLPAFLQILGKNMKGNARSYWKLARKRVLKLNLDYMMSRSNIYAPQAKLAWLIENAIDVAGEGIHLSHQNVDPDEDAKEERDESAKLLRLCQDYIGGRPISKEKKKTVLRPYLETLDKIKEERKTVRKAKEALLNSDFKKALRYLRLATEGLIQNFELIGAKMQAREKEYNFFERIMSLEITKSTFLKAFVMIESGRVGTALATLDQTALFATMARLPETTLTLNYLKGLLYIFNSLYNKAIAQFAFNYELASVLTVTNNVRETLQFKAIIGGAITNFLIDQQEEAFEQVQNAVKKITTRSLSNLMIALIDSGDYFLALGFPEISSNLYSKALECAIDAKKKWKFAFLLSKMKKAYMASSLLGAEVRPSSDIALLIDKFHEIKDIEKFNELITELALFTNKLYEPFELFSEGARKLTSFYDLPENFRNNWECVKIQENEETGRTFLVCFREEVGLVAFDVLLDRELDGVPENYLINLRPTAKIRIDPPDEINETLFLIRAVIKVRNEDRDLEIIRKLPVFFKQMKI